MGAHRAAFFDRDGTINVDYGHVYRLEDLAFVEGVPAVIREYNNKGMPVLAIAASLNRVCCFELQRIGILI